jgi:hypothetical protein
MLCRDLIFAVGDHARPVPMIALAILLVFLTVWCHQLSRFATQSAEAGPVDERTEALLA